MRKIAILVVVVALLLAGCSAGSNTKAGAKSSAKAAPEYSGFMDMKAGMWAESAVKSGSDKVTMRTEIIEYSPTLAKFQVTIGQGDTEVVSQIWTNPDDGTVSKYIIKTGNDVRCLDAKQVPSGYVPQEGDKYPPEKPGVSYEYYNMSNGKSVYAAKFSTSSGETWVSSEVPFGLVKVVSNGKTTLSLTDFGQIGAKSAITDAEMADCTDLSGIVKVAAQPAEEDTTEATVEEAPAEEEPAAVEEGSSNIVATATYKGEAGKIDCSACEGMPPVPMKACLAACK